MALDFAATYKILVLGDSNVGKTCIVHRYCDERYYDTYISTIGKFHSQRTQNNYFKRKKYEYLLFTSNLIIIKFHKTKNKTRNCNKMNIL